MKIGITLTSSLHVGQEYIDLTCVVAKTIAQKGYKIIYGGTSYGMMRELADTYKTSGGIELVGVMAKDLMAVTKGYVAYEKLDKTYLVDTMGQRIAKISELSDCFLILPGGYGTLEELAVIIGGKVNKLHSKPIAIYNFKGFYDIAISFFNELKEKDFSKVKLDEIVFVGENIEDIIAYFEKYQPDTVPDKFV